MTTMTSLSSEGLSSIASSATPLVSVEEEQRIRHFLNYECRLLDDRRFQEWVELFTEDASYEIPVRVNREEGVDPFSRSRAFDDTKQTLKIRIDRLHTEFAWSEQPPSRVRHYISNVMIAPSAKPGELDVVVNELVYRSRGDQVAYDLLSMQRFDTLRDGADGLRIVNRLVRLDNTTVGAHNLSMFF